MKDLDVVVVGELNADLILQDIPSFPEMGKEKIARNMTLTMGSASAIYACNIARLGLETGFIGKIGDDVLGQLVLDRLENSNVDCNGIMVDGSVQTGVTVVMTYPDDYAMLTFMGAMERFSVRNVDPDYLNRARHMHLSSYYLQPGLRPGCPELFRQAKEMGLSTSFDPGWDPSENWGDDILDVLPYVDILFPNRNEAICISGQSSVESAMDKLSEIVGTVVITLGTEGAICRTAEKTIRTRPYKVHHIDTTGAGDSFNTGFIYQWLQDADTQTCMQYGSACAAIACTRLGGTTASPTLDELEAFLSKHPENIVIEE